MVASLIVDREQISTGSPGHLSFDRARMRGNSWTAVKIKLDTSVYATGGFPLEVGVTRMARIFDAYQMAGWDPFHRPIQANGYQAVLVVNPNSGSGIKLQVFYNGVELADASSTVAGKFIWVIFHGLR